MDKNEEQLSTKH